ncbi:restriction endonuclease subunit S [Ruegeria sp. HKCCD6428]|uniref:restriction endonuclease subunit S n=1 Tax=Ruegeria sp. HKCCD6428 TaxID=2683002 RepID=UPI001491B617|nr:restriction endonuclease subunit S [Ruegeria sp. HKCCD6428]NOC84540.1 hypothetical protein [Ruegeria sp. HKCCD6428]
MSKLPNGWKQASGEEVFELVRGVSYKKAESRSDYEDGYVGILRATNLQNGIADANDLVFAPDANVSLEQFLKTGDLLIATSSGSKTVVGKAAQIVSGFEKFSFGAFCSVARSMDKETSDFLSYYFKSNQYRGYVENVALGVNINNFRTSDLKAMPIPLPPLPEQKRIVRKLDTLSARTTAARTDLTAIAKLVERYRMSVLKLAFEGVLTADWRVSHKIGKSASQETKRMLEEQRQALVDENGKQRKSRSAKADSHRIPVELSHPSEWASTTMEEITSPVRLIQYGILKPGPDEPDGVPYVKVMNIKGGVVELEKIKHTTREIHQQYMRSSLKTGDLLLTIRGTVGRMAFVPESLDGGNITQDTVRIDILEAMSSAFVFWYFHSPKAQKYFRENQKGVAVRGINVGDVRPMEVPLPSRAEQDEIVRTIENAFAKIDRLAAEAEKALKLTDRLDQQILAKAFAGELVPQDPNDEPASVLLDRIREARANAPKPKRSLKNEGRTAARAPRKNAAMTKNRQDEDVFHKPYLAELLRNLGGPQGAEALFKQSQLPVADFCKQLAWEVDQGHIKDQQNTLVAN